MNSYTYESQLGLTNLANSWAPSLNHLIRRRAVLREIEMLPGKRVIEAGCGVGAILYDLAQRGYEGVGVELSAGALELARGLHADSPFTILHETELAADASKPFDLLVSTEVLEHVEADTELLQGWVKKIRPNGGVVITVPAYMKHWTESDEWAGHLRRYEKTDIVNLAKNSDIDILKLYTIGFPILNSVNFARGRRDAALRLSTEADQTSRTLNSGMDRRSELKLQKHFQSPAGRALIEGQALFDRVCRNTLGTNFVLVGRVT